MANRLGEAVARESLLTELAREAQPRNLLAAFFAGLVIALSAIVSGIGVAALVFTGPLQPFLFSAIGVVLFGAAVMLAVLSCTSSYPGSICLPQEVPAVILGLLGTTVYTLLVQHMTPAEALPVVLLIIALATVITGLSFLLLGTLRLAGFIRFIPYPLVGGVLAGLGWLLVQGGVTVVLGDPLRLSELGTVVEADHALPLGSALLVALALLTATRLSSHFSTIPGVLAGGILLFYLVTLVAGSSPIRVLEAGWLLGPFPDAAGWSPPTWSAITHLDGQMVWQMLPIIGTLVVVSTISTLLYASGLELGVRRDMDLNHELRGCGWANVFAGLGGGVPGFHSASDSMLGYAMGAPFRLTGICAAVIVVVVLFTGFSALAWLPRPVLAGLLLFLGISLLLSWVVEGYRRLPLGDWLVVVLILVVAAWFGFREGIAVGLVAGVVLFTLNYSRVPVAKHELTAAELHSNVDRATDARHLLDERGRAVHVITLQGFIFFGTAHKVLERVLARLEQDPPMQFLVLDFERVSGLDTSSIITFRKLEQVAEARGFSMVLTGLSAIDREMLENSELDVTGNPNIRIASDLDHGLEYCEQALLEAAGHQDGVVDLTRALPGLLEGGRLDRYAETCTFEPGQRLIRQGEPSDDMYIILEGDVSVRLEGSRDDRRLRSYGPGTLVGEMAMYLGTKRSASVVADTATRCIRLSRHAIERMMAEEPTLAADLHRTIAARLAERLARNNELLHQLS